MTIFGAWQPGDPVGGRKFCEIGTITLEARGALPDATLAYETWGELNPAADNAILVLHALTGDSHIAGSASAGHSAPGWWDALVGPGRPLDTNQWFIVAPNVLGGCQGSTGPASFAPDGQIWGARFPYLTVRDQVTAEIRLADHLGINQWAGIVGGSMGGMRVLEWSIMAPDRMKSAVVLASTPAATAEQISWCQAQILAIKSDPAWQGGDYSRSTPGPVAGLSLARRIAHITYRSEIELDQRFGRSPQAEENPLGGGGRFAVESYLDHQAAKLCRRFDAGSYVVLTEAMNSHDLGRGRGGVPAAIRRVKSELVVAAVDTDRLYPPRLSKELTVRLPQGSHHEIQSDHGHDGFLIETAQVGNIIRSTFGSQLLPVTPILQ